MPWKMDGNQIAMDNGNPVWIGEDKKEQPFDAGETLGLLSKVTKESIQRKEKVRELEGQMSVFEGIDDPTKFMKDAKKAMSTVQGLDEKKLIDAGKLDEVTKNHQGQLAEIKTAHETAVNKLMDQLSGKDGQIQSLLIKGGFEKSEFIREKTVLTPTFAFDHFRKNFGIEDVDGDLVAVGKRGDGEKIYTRDPKRPGQYASVDEAIEILVSEHADKDHLLRSGSPGSGSKPPGQNHNDADLEKLSPVEKLSAARAAQT